MIATNEIKSNWFYSTETKQECAKRMAKGDRSAFVDMDGMVRCKRCKAPRMFLLDGVYGGEKCHKWLPIACNCKDDRALKEYHGECPF